MNNGILIERACIADIDKIMDIENQCFDNGDRFSRKQMSYLIDMAHGECLALWHEGVLAAYASVLMKTNARNLRIYSIAVLPSEQGNKFGHKLVAHIFDYAKLHGLNEVTLEVNVNNTRAINLYKNNGFDIVSTIPNYYHDGSNAYRMKKKIQ